MSYTTFPSFMENLFKEKPKLQRMGILSVRLSTFTTNFWPHMDTFPPKIMAEAGFYFTGLEKDLVMCFYCNLGVGSWIPEIHDPWIHHSLYSPRCPFLPLCKGVKYVEAIYNLDNSFRFINFTEKQVIAEMQRIKRMERCNTSAFLFSDLHIPPIVIVVDTSDLEDQNKNLSDSFKCKMCMETEIQVLFLPCGHLISCGLCSVAVTKCPICRKMINARLRVDMDDGRSLNVYTSSTRLEKLAIENCNLMQRKQCSLCCKKDLLQTTGATFVPCGHLITCNKCAEKFTKCPSCGKLITGLAKTFLS